MECEHYQEHQDPVEQSRKQYILPIAIIIGAAMISGAWVWTDGHRAGTSGQLSAHTLAALEQQVLPSSGAVLPVVWGDIGKRLIASGVIDRAKFDALYAERGGLNSDERALLERDDSGQVTMTANNAPVLLNLFWAVGLANESAILQTGSMMDKRYGGAGNFASTGGWTVARGSAMSHYAAHRLIALTDTQQELVRRVAHGIYRPCCDNPTDFPDCNHGMAMLGLLEMMASQGATEDQMYQAALQVNAYWFPDTYLTIARYMASQGTPWQKVDPKIVLGADYSSASGYQRIQQAVAPQGQQGGGSCGV